MFVVPMQVFERKRMTNKGFTLIETIIVLLLLAILLGATGFVFLVSLRAWDSGYIRTGIREDVSYAMDKTARDLTEMADGSLSQYSSIAHTIEYREFLPVGGGDTYVFYLYNSVDASFDSSYTENLYSLRKANITQGDDPALGEGTLILRDLVSPNAVAPATALTINGTLVTLDFILQRGSETVRLKTKIRPRNL
jgi:prepilin-type N-terminal cleavage/methylation domain-containing protein